METPKAKKHLVLVHGACHGAWSWYKVKPQLEAEGHKVHAVDFSGAGANTAKLEDINSLYDYSLPLMDLLETIPSDEKVILVGHSFGGFSLALAADKYPNKVSVAVFVAAFMPDCQHFPSYIYQKDLELARMLVRPIPAKSIMEDMSGAYKFSREGYGSVKKVYIVCKQDKVLREDFQRWQIENEQNVTEVMEIEDADHMAMLCKPQQLSQLLLGIADKYS